MRNIRLDIAYDGTNYYGWQYQPGKLTIQGIMEERLSRMLKEPIRLQCAGRTDTGVHAWGQVANFHTSQNIAPDALQRGLNSMLPKDILVTKTSEAEEGFHARFQVKDKTYIYRIIHAKFISPFERNYAWHIFFPLNLEAMRQAAQYILGTHNFTSFQGSGCTNQQLEKTVFALELAEDYLWCQEMSRVTLLTPDTTKMCGMPHRLIRITIRADGFLRHMVRNIVGTLVEVGRGRLVPEDISRILAACDRTQAGPTAPACGLYLAEVNYGVGALAP